MVKDEDWRVMLLVIVFMLTMALITGHPSGHVTTEPYLLRMFHLAMDSVFLGSVGGLAIAPPLFLVDRWQNRRKS